MPGTYARPSIDRHTAIFRVAHHDSWHSGNMLVEVLLDIVAALGHIFPLG
ncbi:hypothetical protein [Actinoplanes sp. NPDC051411]